MSKILEFHLKDQILSGGFPVVSDSRNMVSAHFVLDMEPTGSVTAIFCGPTNKPYCVLLDESRICKIPWEVLVLPEKTAASHFSVSLVIGERLTTSCAVVPLIPSGYAAGETPEPPTPTVYEKLLDEHQKTKTEVAEAIEKAVVLISVNEASFEVLKELFDSARTVILYEGEGVNGRYYTCSARTEYSITFTCVIGDNHYCLEYSEEGVYFFEASYIQSSYVEQIYDPKSQNPLSGVAVAEAVKKAWTLLDDVTFTETVASYSLDLSAGSYTELYIEGVVYAAARTMEKQNFSIGSANTITIARVAAAFGHASYDKVYIRARLSISPSGTYIGDVTASLFGYTLSGTHDEVTGRFTEKAFTGRTAYPSLYMTVAGQFAENTTFKVWGR